MTKKNRQGSSYSVQVALSCLFAALLCTGAYISILLPISPVPLALDNFFAILGGLLLGPLWGGVASAIYVGIGALGFPVFSGGRGGIAHIVGPTGGYLVGYIVGAVLAGACAKKRRVISIVLGTILGFLVILVLGSAGLRVISGVDWAKAVAVGVIPFIPGDTIKAAMAIIIASRLGSFVDSLHPGRGAHA
jgi:biotin transport system substrate-specific component